MITREDTATVAALLKSLTPEQHEEVLRLLSRPKGDDSPVTRQELTDLLARHQKASRKHDALQLEMHAQGTRLNLHNTRVNLHEDRLADYAKRIRSLEVRDNVSPAANVFAAGLALWFVVVIVKAITAPTTIIEG